MRVPQEKLEMVQMSVEFARDAIKLLALGNAGGAVYVFTKSPFLPPMFTIGAACFAFSFFLCVIGGIVAYLAQWQYGNALKINNEGTLEVNIKLNDSGHRRRFKALTLFWISVILSLIGCAFVIKGCLMEQ
jgi:succinate dehydrogenase/fumarate reductase cytochrome b subunit